MKKAVITSIPFAIVMTLMFYLMNDTGLVQAIISGLLSGFIWIVFLRLMSRLLYNSIKKKVYFRPRSNEELIFESPANHFKNKEAVGGLLSITNERIVFQSHDLNLQNHKWEISTSDIKKLTERKTWGIIPNGLTIETSKNAIEKFVVDEPDKWVRIFKQLSK
ncbi:MAG TPA: GRAM domain-containing protein [Balneolales bacterium]|nr:GRAM domain-containing protein [Balneolales bacterium]